MWDGVDYLSVDEASMIGCEMLHNISSVLTEVKGRTAAFGGVNVVFAGDFAQLPLIGDVRLYKNIDTRKTTMGLTNKAHADLGEASLAVGGNGGDPARNDASIGIRECAFRGFLSTTAGWCF